MPKMPPIFETLRRRAEGLRYVALGEVYRAWPGAGGQGGAVVVLTPGHLGDVLHAVPMLKALRAARPADRLVWLVGPWSESLARRYGETVDEIVVFAPSLPALSRGNPAWRQSAWRQARIAAGLRREGVAELVAPMDGVGRFLANALRPARWVGIGDRRPPRVAACVRTWPKPYEKDRCEADALAGMLGPLGVEASADGPSYATTAAEREAAAAYLAAQGVSAERPLAVLAPGSGWSGKNWPPERFGAVGDWLAGERGFQVAWVGGPGEEGLVRRGGQPAFDWVGKLPLPLAAAVIERAALFVGNDGGLLHFAAALGVPTVSLWGPTSPGKWAPRGAAHRHVRKAQRCPGCVYWDWRERCRRDGACMKAIAVEDAQSAIRDLLRRFQPQT
jgi:ADP-heptose:LPS heptosyltransferase